MILRNMKLLGISFTYSCYNNPLIPLQHRADEDYQSDMYQRTIQKATALSQEFHNGSSQENCYLLS